MKKYLLFGGNDAFPSTGWLAFWNDYENLADAVEKIQEIVMKHSWQWAHIVDKDTKEMIHEWFA